MSARAPAGSRVGAREREAAGERSGDLRVRR
jgi:hypothetical protein